jgi:hypothetical protein
MMGALADPFQFLIVTDFIRPFALRKIFAHPGKKCKPVFPEKKAIDRIGMKFPQSGDRVETADRQFHGQFILHAKDGIPGSFVNQ